MLASYIGIIIISHYSIRMPSFSPICHRGFVGFVAHLPIFPGFSRCRIRCVGAVLLVGSNPVPLESGFDRSVFLDSGVAARFFTKKD